VLTPSEVLFLQDETRKIQIDEAIIDYMIEIVNRTRTHTSIELGISPRGTAALFRATQALAMVENRNFVIPDDVKRLVNPVFGHRLVMDRNGSRGRSAGAMDVRSVLSEIVSQIPVPA
jgi:MoxR-like ATPase